MSIRILIVDDSALMRQLLTEILTPEAGFEVVGAAPDPYVARELIKSLNPDVLTLDVEMPRMDGLTFLENLMRLRPMPVVMVSSLTHQGAEATLHALELGAFDFVAKPKIDLANTFKDYSDDLIAKLKAAVKSPIGGRGSRAPMPVPTGPLKSWRLRTTEQIIAIGASTGGTEAIKAVLEKMPANAPAILITQHIPAAFSGPFAERMNRNSAMAVCEAEHGQVVIPGHVYIAPGDQHLLLARDGARYVCQLSDAPPENRHRPSVDTMFRSIARHASVNVVGALLTGMGEDGARGLKELLDAGARTLVQDEASCIVFGMPGAAVKQGAAQEIVPLDRIAERLLALSSQQFEPRASSASV